MLQPSPSDSFLHEQVLSLESSFVFYTFPMPFPCLALWLTVSITWTKPNLLYTA